MQVGGQQMADAEGGAHDRSRKGPSTGTKRSQQGNDRESEDRQGSAEDRQGAPSGQAGDVPERTNPDGLNRSYFRSPLYFAENIGRYQRQALIKAYQETFNCRLVAMCDQIFDISVTLFEELIFNARPTDDLHLLLVSPGGDGEVAVRLVRAAQARCRELTVIVPDIAKSAGTLLVLGAHQILMGPTSDLGPVDPQFAFGDSRELVSAKDMIAAVERALREVAEQPDTYPLHSALLSDVNSLMVERARSALGRTDDLLKEALRSNPDRTEQDVRKLAQKLHKPLIEAPKDHGAIFGASDARKLGLPVVECDPSSDQWRLIWQLWTYYFALGPAAIYEGDQASQVHTFG
jgi:ATP-dependent protease ClpP protease subunit